MRLADCAERRATGRLPSARRCASVGTLCRLRTGSSRAASLQGRQTDLFRTSQRSALAAESRAGAEREARRSVLCQASIASRSCDGSHALSLNRSSSHVPRLKTQKLRTEYRNFLGHTLKCCTLLAFAYVVKQAGGLAVDFQYLTSSSLARGRPSRGKRPLAG
jgi:hypothetical protein